MPASRARPAALAAPEVERRRQQEVPEWSVVDGHLSRVFKTGNWQASMLLAGAIAQLAEAADHHPDLLVTYPRLTVRLMTHDAKGITTLDFELAAMIDTVAAWPGGDTAAEMPPRNAPA